MVVVETISWIFDKLFFCVPRLQIVNQFEGAVFLRSGRLKSRFRFRSFWKPWKLFEMRSLDPGMYWIWPSFDEIYTLNRLDQSVDLRCQSAITKDGKDVAISGAILYNIFTPYKALLNVDGVDRCLSRVALGVLVDCVNAKTFEECRDLARMKEEVRKGIKEVAKDWGLKIREVQITDFGHTINLRLLKNEEDSILLDG